MAVSLGRTGQLAPADRKDRVWHSGSRLLIGSYAKQEKPMKYSRSLNLLFVFGVLSSSLMACASVPATPALPQQTQVTQPTEIPVLLPPTTAIPPTLPQQTQVTQPTEIPVVLPSTTPIPPSPTPDLLPIEFPEPGTVVLDFVALVCNARWTNGAFDLPCPGNRNDIAEGFITSMDNAVAEGMIPVVAPVLIALPGLGGEHGAGLFGRYPPLTIQSNDTFYAILACQENTACDVVVEITSIDAEEHYQHDMGWSWQHSFGGGPVPVQVVLSPLAGQTL